MTFVSPGLRNRTRAPAGELERRRKTPDQQIDASYGKPWQATRAAVALVPDGSCDNPGARVGAAHRLLDLPN